MGPDVELAVFIVGDGAGGADGAVHDIGFEVGGLLGCVLAEGGEVAFFGYPFGLYREGSQEFWEVGGLDIGEWIGGCPFEGFLHGAVGLDGCIFGGRENGEEAAVDDEGDARKFASQRLLIECVYLGAIDGWVDDAGVEHSREVEVVDVYGLAGDNAFYVVTGNGFADVLIFLLLF